MANLLVRGGTLVDGTGAAARAADVRVRAGRVAEIGPDLEPAGEPVIDSSGAYVTPGFIESHSHFDGSMWWDPSCDPMPAYGTTTAVIGNCGLTVAPLSAVARSSMVELFCFIEDLPLPAFQHAIPWSWETWPEYRSAALDHPAALNVGVFVGHQALRTFVMGDEAWTRPATDSERAAMARILDEALSVGALGFSTTFMDTDRDNREVPSRAADDAEFDALIAVLSRHPGTTLQFVPRFMQPEFWQDDLDRLAVALRTPWGPGQLGCAALHRPASGRARRPLFPQPTDPGSGDRPLAELQRGTELCQSALRALDHVARRARLA